MIRWARVTLVAAWMVVLAGFAVGVQPTTVTAGDQQYSCGTVIPTSWLVAGTTSESAAPAEDPEQRRAAAACAPALDRPTLIAWGLLGLGGLIGLAAWTILRETAPTTRMRAIPSLP